MNTNRIPAVTGCSFDAMQYWFAEMAERGLIFHPDESPEDIVGVSDGKPIFSADECSLLTAILGQMYEKFGDDVHEAAYPVFMKAAGQYLDS